ncbi:hypothetical protein, partial [Salmonella sp. s55044]|uniref:hypothetical protein n=1 Tax=Salmonella sp. s55044 TaxID=3159677 RepID=UPI00397FA39B
MVKNIYPSVSRGKNLLFNIWCRNIYPSESGEKYSPFSICPKNIYPSVSGGKIFTPSVLLLKIIKPFSI